MKTLTLTTTRHIKGADIPAEATFLVYASQKDAEGVETTSVTFKTTERAAKMAYTKLGRDGQDYSEYGWKAIEERERHTGAWAW